MAKKNSGGGNKSMVESLIDSMVENSMSATDAVASVVNTPKSDVESGEDSNDVVSFKEGEDIVCPRCGGTEFEEGFVESEDGQIPAIRCTNCDLGLVEQVDDQESEDGLMEAEIDENDPTCPVCGSKDLSGEMVENEGQEDLIITCGGCKATMVVAD